MISEITLTTAEEIQALIEADLGHTP